MRVVPVKKPLQIRSLKYENDLKKGPFGILEPQGEVLNELSLIDIAIVPGLAFSADGKRLGRGKGYYDRLLKRIPQCYKIGICFSFQLINHIPTTQYDVMMNEVIAL